MTRAGKSASGEQRYRCLVSDCPTQTFMLNYRYKGYEPGIKEQIADMALNGGGIRGTTRVLGISKNTVIAAIKKAPIPVRVNPAFVLPMNDASEREVSPGRICIEAETDERWSYVREKSNPRWFWYAVDHASNTMLTYALGQHRDKVFNELKALL